MRGYKSGLRDFQTIAAGAAVAALPHNRGDAGAMPSARRESWMT